MQLLTRRLLVGPETVLLSQRARALQSGRHLEALLPAAAVRLPFKILEYVVSGRDWLTAQVERLVFRPRALVILLGMLLTNDLLQLILLEQYRFVQVVGVGVVAAARVLVALGMMLTISLFDVTQRRLQLDRYLALELID